jgi:hypothetical protein
MVIRNNRPENKEKLSKQAYDQLFGTDEKRKNHSLRMSRQSQEWWSDPEYREKLIDIFSKRMTAQHQDPKFADALSKRMSVQMSKTMKRLYKDPEYMKAHSRRCLETWENPEYRKKMIKCGRGNKGHHTSNKAGRIHYRSGWELDAYLCLDADSKVMKYSAEPFGIPYIDPEGIERRYYPDILIEYFDGYLELVEIKPHYQLSNSHVQSKMLAGLLYSFRNHMGFKVWTERTWPIEVDGGVSYAS